MIRAISGGFILLLCLILGYWIGRTDVLKNLNSGVIGERKPLYYRHPMNPKVTSMTPAKDEMGMDYLAIYAEPIASSVSPSESGKILYYRHPMGAADTSPLPKKDEVGMDYVPVYDKEIVKSGQIEISQEKIQKLGVQTEIIKKRPLIHSIRALGSIQIDEQRIQAVTPKFEGWIQHLLVNTTGQNVKRGQALLEIYSPELMTAQQEYLIARQGQQALQQGSAQARSMAEQLTASALQRLHNWDIAPAQLQQLQVQAKISDTLSLLSPVNGVVIDKPAQQGMRFMPGELLFRIADLSTVWLIAEVFEQDINEIQLNHSVQLSINAYPNKVFSGKVGFIYPTLTTETRTIKVRIELPNNDGLLKPGLYGSVTLLARGDKLNRLAVPDSAVLDSGIRQMVLVQKAEGRFEPHLLKLGHQADGYWEVLDGLNEGDKVVTRANFLIDAESNLKSALDSFDNQGSAADQVVQETKPQEH